MLWYYQLLSDGARGRGMHRWRLLQPPRAVVPGSRRRGLEVFCVLGRAVGGDGSEVPAPGRGAAWISDVAKRGAFLMDGSTARASPSTFLPAAPASALPAGTASRTKLGLKGRALRKGGDGGERAPPGTCRSLLRRISSRQNPQQDGGERASGIGLACCKSPQCL